MPSHTRPGARRERARGPILACLLSSLWGCANKPLRQGGSCGRSLPRRDAEDGCPALPRPDPIVVVAEVRVLISRDFSRRPAFAGATAGCQCRPYILCGGLIDCSSTVIVRKTVNQLEHHRISRAKASWGKCEDGVWAESWPHS
jgi:hypothetical protein